LKIFHMSTNFGL